MNDNGQNGRSLPDGWGWSRLGDVSISQSGAGFPKSYQGELEGDYPFAKVSDISNAVKNNGGSLISAINYLSSATAKKIHAKEFPVGTTLFAKIGEAVRLNRRAFASVPVLADNNVMGLIPNINIVSPKFLYHFMHTVDLYEYSQATTVPSVRKSDVEQIPFPLPPLSEQEQIVSRIDELLSDLDAGVAALKRVRLGLKRYKASVLKAAITGKLLNDKLTNVNGKLPEGWRWAKLPELGYLGRGKSKHRPRNAEFLYGGDYPFIQTGDIRYADGIITSYTQTYSEAGLAQSKLWPKGTLCITIAANIADTAILGFDACFPDSVVGFLSNEDVEVKFIEFYIRTIKDSLERFAPATAQKNINLDVLQKVPIPLPALDEQRRIVAEVERRLSVVGEVESAVEVGLVRAGRLRQSVLRSAFEGRLA